MKNFIFLFIISLLACSQNNNFVADKELSFKTVLPENKVKLEDQKVTQDETQKLKSFSPKDIYEYLNNNQNENVESIWKNFGINNNEYIKTSDFRAKETFSDLNGDGLKDIILEISNNERGGVRYLLFLKTQTDYIYAGYSDVKEMRYANPTFKVISILDKYWFAVNQAGGGGSGVSIQIEVWKPIKKGNSNEVLSYISKGHTIDGRINGSIWDRYFKSELESRKFIDGKYILQFETEVDFRISSGKDLADTRNFLKKQKAFYVLNKSTGEFLFDSRKSTITEDELENVFNYEEPLGKDKFVKYYFAELKNIARNGTKLQKDWLKRLISEFQEVKGINELRDDLYRNK